MEGDARIEESEGKGPWGRESEGEKVRVDGSLGSSYMCLRLAFFKCLLMYLSDI